MEIVVRRYRTLDGAEPFTQWLDGLTDPKAKALVLVRIERLALGACGDVRPLLCGSDKRRQDKEIRRAIDLWREYRSRRSRGRGASR